MNSALFSTRQKIFFYIISLINKLKVFTECEEGKLQLLIVEILWTLRPFTHISPSSSFLMYKDYIVTKLGKFYVHKDLQSEISLSPAFERQDINFLFELIGQEFKKKRTVLFIDIGAHVGIYTIGVGNRFRRYKDKFKILSFEPNANNFYSGNSSLLQKNVRANKLSNVKVFEKGLGSKKTLKPNKFGITTVPLDSLLSSSQIKKFDTIFVKADIEGFETDALKGAKNLLTSSQKIIILVEDCVDKDVVSFLKSKNFIYFKKLTPYNSFWVKNDFSK